MFYLPQALKPPLIIAIGRRDNSVILFDCLSHNEEKCWEYDVGTR